MASLIFAGGFGMSPEEIHSPIYKPADLAYVVQRDDGPYLMAVQNEVQVAIPLTASKLFQLLEQVAQTIRRTHAAESSPMRDSRIDAERAAVSCVCGLSPKDGGSV
jgi:hypothetical protein